MGVLKGLLDRRFITRLVSPWELFSLMTEAVTWDKGEEGVWESRAFAGGQPPLYTQTLGGLCCCCHQSLTFPSGSQVGTK